MKSHVVERSNKAEITPEEQSEKTENCFGECMERNTAERGVETEIDRKKRIKRCRLAGLVYIQR